MEIQTFNTIPAFTSDPVSSVTENIPALIDTMKHSYTWLKGELNALILLNHPEKQIVLTALHGKTEIKSFQSDGSVTIQIIEGSLVFNTRKDSVLLNAGQLLTFNEKAKYSLVTLEESVFLLTISKGILKK